MKFGDIAMQNPKFVELAKMLVERNKRTKRRRALKRRKKAEHERAKE